MRLLLQHGFRCDAHQQTDTEAPHWAEQVIIWRLEKKPRWNPFDKPPGPVAVVIVQPLNLSLKWQNHRNITAEWMKVKNKPFWLPVFARPHGNTERVCCTNPEMPLCIILKNKHANPSPFCSSWMRRNGLINYMSLCQWHCIVTYWRHAKQKLFRGYLKTAWELSAGTEVVGGKCQSVSTKKLKHWYTVL